MLKRRIAATVFWGVRRPQGQRRPDALCPDAWEGLHACVREPDVIEKKHHGWGFSMATFAGDHRSLKTLERVHALVLDLDKNCSVEQAAALFRNEGLAYSTHSHTRAYAKSRLVIPFARPVSRDEYDILWRWAADRCAAAGHVADEQAKGAAQFFFGPAHREGAPYAFREIEGPALDVAKVLGSAERARPHPHRDTTGPKLALKRPTSKTRAARRDLRVEDEDARAAASVPFFARAFELAGLAHGTLKGGALAVTCPWDSQHSPGPDSLSSTVVLASTSENGFGFFRCSHSHCVKRTVIDLLEALDPEALWRAREQLGAGMVRAKIVRASPQHLDAYRGRPAFEQISMQLVPVGFEIKHPFGWTVKIGSSMHTGALDGLPVEKLLGRRVDVVLRGRDVKWAALVPESRTRTSLRNAAQKERT